jgi:hypothetical protein
MSTLRVAWFIQFHFRLLMSTVTHPFDHYTITPILTNYAPGIQHEPYFDERRRHYMVDRLISQIEHLGYRVHLEPVAAPAA